MFGVVKKDSVPTVFVIQPRIAYIKGTRLLCASEHPRTLWRPAVSPTH